MSFLSRYLPSYPLILTYMLQSSEYDTKSYLSWWWRTYDFRRNMNRRVLDRTKKATLLLFLNRLVYGMGIITVLTLGVVGLSTQNNLLTLASIILCILLPTIIGHYILPIIWLGEVLIQKPREKEIISRAKKIIGAHKAYKIAIAGSYGKTTAKEALSIVLSEGKHTASTPGNYNTPLGISRFAENLSGSEEVLVFELGESHVRDVKELCELTQPNLGIITGINEAHLSTFGSIDNTIATIFELKDYLGENPLYVNSESEYVRKGSSEKDVTFTRKGVNGWSVSNISTSIDGTRFTISRGGVIIKAHVDLLGEHNIGVLSAVIDIADKLGLNSEQIEAGLRKLKIVPHRLQPRYSGGAWIIDDTYNGNIEGVKAGIEVLRSLAAKKRIYVTPGLVEQGEKTAEIHEEIGRCVADVADRVILMKNSTTVHIQRGLRDAEYSGQVQVINDPLEYYKNIDQTVAAGDVVLMQNDWTDNYA